MGQSNIVIEHIDSVTPLPVWIPALYFLALSPCTSSLYLSFLIWKMVIIIVAILWGCYRDCTCLLIISGKILKFLKSVEVKLWVNMKMLIVANFEYFLGVILSILHVLSHWMFTMRWVLLTRFIDAERYIVCPVSHSEWQSKGFSVGILTP